MKKLPLFASLALILALFFITPHAFAGTSAVHDNVPTPRVTPGAKATEKAGNTGNLHGKRQIFRGTIAAVDASNLTLTLPDGSSQTFSLTTDARIRIPAAQKTGNTLQVGMRAIVMAANQQGTLTALFVLAIPGRPLRVHRVGVVTSYTAGTSIGIKARDGNEYTFALTADTKILPADRAAQLASGSVVTIIAPRDPSSTVWTAKGIVVHSPAQ